MTEKKMILDRRSGEYKAQTKSGWYLAVNVSEYYERSALMWILKLVPFLIYLHFIVFMRK